MKKHNNIKDKEDNSSWIVGRKPVFDLIKNKPDRIIDLFILDSFKDENLNNIDRAKIKKLSKEDFLRLFRNIEELNHQGVCARIHPSNSLSIDQLIKKSKSSGRGLIIGLDQIQDPHNLGAIFRSAEALGADGIFYCGNKSATVNSTVRRISVGATEFLPYSEVSNISNAILKFKEAGYWIFGTSLRPESQDIEDTDLIFPMVLMFGSESSGLRNLTEKSCDKLVHINQYGITESLNVASALSAMLFYVRSKLQRE